VLYHVKNPLVCLERAASVARETLVIETLTGPNDIKEPVMRYLLPCEVGNDPTNFFAINVACIEAMLRYLGFRRVEHVLNPNQPNDGDFKPAYLPRIPLGSRYRIARDEKHKIGAHSYVSYRPEPASIQRDRCRIGVRDHLGQSCLVRARNTALSRVVLICNRERQSANDGVRPAGCRGY
jgi:hypothetical protein